MLPMGTIRIGISGWRYEPWRGIFYPRGLAQRRELEFASRAFNSIELNGSFYARQTPKSYATWYDESPEDFVFSIKGPRYITHIRRLNDVEGPLANFFASGILNLGEKTGPFLWQFPPSFRYDEERFEQFFSLLPRDSAQALTLARRRETRMQGRARLAIDRNRPLRHAVEIRHESFATPAFDNDVKVRAPFDADRLMQELDLKRADKSFVFPDRQALKSVRPAPPMPETRWRSRDARPSAKSS